MSLCFSLNISLSGRISPFPPSCQSCSPPHPNIHKPSPPLKYQPTPSPPPQIPAHTFTTTSNTSPYLHHQLKYQPIPPLPAQIPAHTFTTSLNTSPLSDTQIPWSSLLFLWSSHNTILPKHICHDHTWFIKALSSTKYKHHQGKDSEGRRQTEKLRDHHDY